MPHSRIFILSAALSLGVNVAYAQEPTAPAAQTEPSATTEKEKKICRDETRTGSRISKFRICKTAEEWAELRRQGSKGVDEMYDKKGTGGNTEREAGG